MGRYAQFLKRKLRRLPHSKPLTAIDLIHHTSNNAEFLLLERSSTFRLHLLPPSIPPMRIGDFPAAHALFPGLCIRDGVACCRHDAHETIWRKHTLNVTSPFPCEFSLHAQDDGAINPTLIKTGKRS
ncbi:hypothetical protein, unlikely [Trypanosoma brucei gambiense DAL972]|uniref:Uncharacterized protein n=1 Tax=Trypanosoma brucei gambiense (strain MHOM/CI/86/DAL972) TaxID=679716 RepID=C9ZP18_TRYB9|nr:hypothetical protein, unlikely [Trypanosoma brucei gambiense DAL972]CBH11146.1 hypothetical protein, unlikely [Trypanosoma brucei gambiense DAL972]|eukprot:XP_011773433.1 hypothetical protein, unlikely [Trypanosoma brucei gambiense DAL972]